MIESFAKIRDLAMMKPEASLICACPYDESTLKAIETAGKDFNIHPILVGNKELINKRIKEYELNPEIFRSIEIIGAKDSSEVDMAISRALNEKRSILMKGMVNTGLFLSKIFHDKRIKTAKTLISHVSVMQIPDLGRLLFITDGTVNICPTLDQKVSIVSNVIDFCHSLELEIPKVSVIGINERITSKNADLVDAAVIAKMGERGQLGICEIEGPMPIDTALSKKAALKKEIISPVGGSADCLVCSNLESAANLIKGLVYLGKAKTAGILLGTDIPVALTSRNDNIEAKLNSICIAKLCAKESK